MQECFAEERRGLHSGFAHANWVGGVDFWLEQPNDEWEKDLAEDSGPFFVLA